MAAGDLDALSRSFWSRVGLLGLVVAAGVGAAVWAITRDQGRGEPEARHRVMVVADDDEAIDYGPALERAGFEIAVDTLGSWERRAHSLLDDVDARGIELVLELADERGIGFVILERPARFADTLEQLDVEPAPSEIEDFDGRDYAVLSVGDLGFPHALTVDEPGRDPLVRLPGHDALVALMRQPAIDHREDPDLPTVEELNFEKRIQRGHDMVALPPGFAARIDKAERELAARVGDEPGLRILTRGLQTGTAVPTPDGGLLVVRYELDVFSDNAETLEVEPLPTVYFDWLADGRLDGPAERCVALAGGELDTDERPRIHVSDDGSALAIDSSGPAPSGSVALWRKLAGEGCEWAEAGELPAAPHGIAFGVLAPRPIAEQGVVAARVLESSVRVWTDGGDSSVDLPLPVGQRARDVDFVDGSRLVAATETLPDNENANEDDDARVYTLQLLDRRRVGARVEIAIDDFAEGRRPQTVTVVDAGPDVGLTVLLTADNPHGEVELIALHVDAAALALAEGEHAGEAEAESESESETGSVPDVAVLAPSDLDARVLAHARRISGVTVSPDGAGPRSVAFAHGSERGPDEIVVLALDGSGDLRRVTDNHARDFGPRFTADGRHLTINTLSRMSISQSVFIVPRLAELEPAS